jgi:hypothetical protein
MTAPFGCGIAGDGESRRGGQDARAAADRTAVSDPSPEKQAAIRNAIGPPRPVPSLFGYFLGTAPQERREQRSWPRSGEGQDARSHAKK